MSLDTELTGWRQEWQSDNVGPPDLRARVERQSRFMKLGLAADVLVTVVMGGGTTALAIRSTQSDWVLLAAATWLFLAVAWAFGIAINRGNWSPAAMDTATFLDLSVKRCRARLATVRFGLGLFVCELVFGLAWVYRHSDRQPAVLPWLFFSSPAMDFVWLFTLAFCGFLLWYWRRKHAEMAWLLNLRDEDVPSRKPLLTPARQRRRFRRGTIA